MINRMWLNGRWVSNDHPDAAPFVESELERQREAKERAKVGGFELLTPQATMSLFNLTGSAVRQARLGGHVHARVILEVSDSPVYLLDLQSAMDYWRSRRRPDFCHVLDDMRKHGHLLGVGPAVYNVLHVKPIIRIEDTEAV